MRNAEARKTGNTADYLPSLQVLRCIAALLVVLYHTESRSSGVIWHFLYENVFSRGHMGVDMFFVLSGFLMAYLRPDGTGTRVALRFLGRRVLRIWPSYILVTLAYAGLVYYESVSQVVLSLLFLPQSTEPSLVLGFPTLFVGWTLNYEAYFYLLCGVSLLFVPGRWFFHALLAWAVMTLVFLPLAYGVSPLMAPLETPAQAYPFLYMALMANAIVWEFVMGAAVAIVVKRYRRHIMTLPIGLVRGMALGTIVLFVLTFVAFDNKMEPIACGLPSALLVGALVMADLRGVWKVRSWQEALGDASYCTYLLHPLWIAFLMPWLEASAGMEALAVLAVVSGTLASAILMHRLFERPLLSWGRRPRVRPLVQIP